MNLIVLTGGIGSGKSTLAAYLNRQGVAVIDADVIARRVVEPGEPGYDLVVESFGEGILRPDRTVDRSLLGRLVFDDATGEKRKSLERATHPYIMRMIREQLWRLFTLRGQTEGIPIGCMAIPRPKVVCIVIPLYYEAGIDRHEFFKGAPVILVMAEPDQRIRRLLDRGLTREEAVKRLSSQLSDDRKVELATYTLANDGTLSDLEEHATHLVRAVIPKLKPQGAAIQLRIFNEGLCLGLLELFLLLLLVARLAYRAKYGGRTGLQYVLDRLAAVQR
ncbi:Dephospho-CoA kinase [Giardia muris]|uniref:Dephospho-CoA kinase n=1 Tax=Giardia muris TaxID=5742 RepID=A0A4Z1SPY7_GIAMU|nr:Dephospho-CoA kinase [Giardia muris]|eukprot:TNJ27730.1 Dephospho-CoA kinase [Giardia muris]